MDAPKVILPNELLLAILEQLVADPYADKNHALSLRTTCRLFDKALKPVTLRTLQLEYTRLDKTERSARPPDDNALRRVGHLCRALYLDMMVMRDIGEVNYLKQAFARVPQMHPFIYMLSERYCLNEFSFTEIEYYNRLASMLEHTPNVTAVRLNLPFQLLSQHCRAATMILGNTLKALLQRPEESATVETLVIDNLTDLTLYKLWRNPVDVANFSTILGCLKHLLVSVRRHDDCPHSRFDVAFYLWEMLLKAKQLESLCLVGLDVNDKSELKTTTEGQTKFVGWQNRAMPLSSYRVSLLATLNITYLELRSLEIHPADLMDLFRIVSGSLKELYLDHVYLKSIVRGNGSTPEREVSYWVGPPNIPPPSTGAVWVAPRLREMIRDLRVCRATNLGYDRYLDGTWARPLNEAPTYDIADPCGLSRSLSQRFVEVVFGMKQPDAPDGSPIIHLPPEEDYQHGPENGQEQPLLHLSLPPPPQLPPYSIAKPPQACKKGKWWDAASYLATPHNPTSSWQRSIDGFFPNCNETTLERLQAFADEAYDGMQLVSELHRQDEEIEGSGAAMPTAAPPNSPLIYE
ncbi:hypothetical protein F4809DRAFT_587620 [Biscogniauxia mediterranea]|nr:hypothetical protein F4809DRAFT_587620 [Biscogniauxia mediterranea]